MSRVLFFGRLRDQAGMSGHPVPLAVPLGLAEFREQVAGSDSGLLAALSAPVIRVAVNGTVLPRGANPVIRPGDEVAFLPPFSGG